MQTPKKPTTAPSLPPARAAQEALLTRTRQLRLLPNGKLPRTVEGWNAAVARYSAELAAIKRERRLLDEQNEAARDGSR